MKNLFLVIGASVFMAASIPVSADLIYLESGGQVVGEAEVFSDRIDSGVDGWRVVPDEDAGSGSFSNARDGKFIQSLPDDQTPGGPNQPPEIHYRMDIQTIGTYRLYLRWDSIVSINNGGNSDSIFADIIELKDGAGGSVADHYEYVRNNDDSDFATNPWEGSGGFEENAGAVTAVPATFDITTAGLYTLRFSQREDGSAVDAWVFQLSGLTAPSGNGPPMSATIPEPACLGLLAVGSLFLLLFRSRRS